MFCSLENKSGIFASIKNHTFRVKKSQVIDPCSRISWSRNFLFGSVESSKTECAMYIITRYSFHEGWDKKSDYHRSGVTVLKTAGVRKLAGPRACVIITHAHTCTYTHYIRVYCERIRRRTTLWWKKGNEKKNRLGPRPPRPASCRFRHGMSAW